MRRVSYVLIAVAVAMLLTACQTTGEDPTAPAASPTSGEAMEAEQPDTSNGDQQSADEEAEMELTSEAFTAGESIPTEYSCDGEDVSPPLSWSNVPEDTQSFALVMDDPDAPGGTFDHWLLYNIPADTRSLERAVPSQQQLSDGSLHGRNSFGNLDYGGPCPPGETHRYNFRLYALDQQPNLEAGVSKQELMEAIDGHILAEAELQGTYTR